MRLKAPILEGEKLLWDASPILSYHPSDFPIDIIVEDFLFPFNKQIIASVPSNIVELHPFVRGERSAGCGGHRSHT
jgi:hypothetical protein